jgi:hypothetical protein
MNNFSLWKIVAIYMLEVKTWKNLIPFILEEKNISVTIVLLDTTYTA